MKKIFFLLMTLLTGYTAAVYRSEPLMLLFIMEALLFLFSFFISFYFKKKLSVEVRTQRQYVEKATPLSCDIQINNQARLPISRFGIKTRYAYQRGAAKEKQWVWGGAERGRHNLQFELSAQYCGIFSFKLERVKVYDYFSLFSRSKKLGIEIETAVFPIKRELYIEMQSFGYHENNLIQDEIKGQKMDAHHEIRQLREYQTGDSKRYIHWKQSARTGLLWIKEFEKETDDCVALLLDLTGIWNADLSQRDAFYELLSAFLHGFIQKSETVWVYWHDAKKKTLVNEAVANTAQCHALLLMLYRLEQQAVDALQEKAFLEQSFLMQKNHFKLGLDLALCWNSTLIYKFSKELINIQIATASFVI